MIAKMMVLNNTCVTDMSVDGEGDDNRPLPNAIVIRIEQFLIGVERGLKLAPWSGDSDYIHRPFSFPEVRHP
jgi:hypothetical protein